MIITKSVTINLTSNRKYYHNKGYHVKNKNQIIVNVKDLPDNCRSKVEVQCDICGIFKKLSYSSYKKSFNNGGYYSCSTKCASEKIKKTNLNKFDVEYASQSDEIIEKVQKTCLEKYGHVCSLHNDKINKKMKESNFKKYGVEYYNNIEKNKQTKKENYGDENYNNREKANKTCLENYGVNNISQRKEIKEKKKKTNLKNLGVFYPLQNNKIKEKVQKTNLEKYDHTCSLRNEEIVKLVKKIKLDKYGNEYYNNPKKISKTRKNNTLKKYNIMIGEDYNIISEKDNLFTIFHSKCNNNFNITYSNLYERSKINVDICTNCYKIEEHTSLLEKDIVKWLKTLNINMIENDRKILDGQELDIYLPKYNLAIEFNGLYWHSEKFKDKKYHLNKTEKCIEKNIQLIHIWEDDWILKKEIVKSIILNKLNMINKKIYGRKCIIKNVTSKIARKFLDENHIQGFVKSSYKIGLYYNDDLVSLMTFGYRYTNSKKEFELIRFANKINISVIGSASKLFKYFLNNNNVNEIFSYADISMFNGKIYSKLNFDFCNRSTPNYYWIINNKKEHRFKYNKKKLISQGYDKNLTEVEIMWNRGYRRLWACGQDKYIYKK